MQNAAIFGAMQNVPRVSRTRGGRCKSRHFCETWLTCEPDLDEVQRVQHQSRDDAAGYTCDEVLVLEIAEDLELAETARRVVTLDRWHVRYRTVAGVCDRLHIRASASSDTCFHSAAYLLVNGRHCRRDLVASLVPEIVWKKCVPRGLLLFGITVFCTLAGHDWLRNHDRSLCTTYAECYRHTACRAAVSGAASLNPHVLRACASRRLRFVCRAYPNDVWTGEQPTPRSSLSV